MFSRIVNCTINPAKAKEFQTALNTEFLPRIQSQPGFVDNLESFDPSTGQFNCVTLWKTEADVKNYDKGLFQEVAASLGPVMLGNPTVLTLPVENSSAHHLAGAAAA